jgi:hypothetical protein
MVEFLSTHWSMIYRAQDGQLDALGEVYSLYWGPLLAYAQYELGLDAEQAEELVQAFTSEVFVDRRIFERADPQKGRFRAYLKTSFRHFVLGRWRRDRARVRQPSGLVSLERLEQLDLAGDQDSPHHVFEKAWGLELLAQALRMWKQECRQRDPKRWQAYELRVLEPLLNGTQPPAYEDICRNLGLDSPKQVMNLITTGNRAIQRHLRAILEQDLTRDLDIDSLRRQRAEELLQTRRVADDDAAHREASREIRDELDEAIDAEILDIRRAFEAGGNSPARVQMRRPPSSIPSSFEGPASEPPIEGSLSAEASRSSLKQFIAAHLDAGENPQEISSREDSRRIVLTRDPTQCDLRAMLGDVLETGPLGTDGPGVSWLRRCLHQQLDGPLPWTLSLPGDGQGKDATATTLSEWFALEQPPLEGLVQLKEFGRSAREHGQSMPKEVATVLYFSAIAMAHLRCGRRITSLEDAKILAGVRWALDQPWVDGPVRELMQETIARWGDRSPDTPG